MSDSVQFQDFTFRTCLGAVCTTTSKRLPRVSATMWRLWPVMRLKLSKPRSRANAVVFTLWLSMLPAVGLGLRPWCWRSNRTTAAFNRRQMPNFVQR